MAERNHVPLAIEWMKDPSQCAEFLIGLIQEFQSLFTLDGGTDMHGGDWSTVETTKKSKGQLPTNLSKQISLAKEAFTICHELKSEVFRLETEWQAAFSNLRQTHPVLVQ